MTRRPKGKLIAYVDKALSIKNYDDGCNYLSKGKYLYNKEITKIDFKQVFFFRFLREYV